jgi:hypothetical protein
MNLASNSRDIAEGSGPEMQQNRGLIEAFPVGTPPTGPKVGPGAARTPPVAGDGALSAPTTLEPGDAATADLRRLLSELRRGAEADPLSNPIQLLALAIGEKIAAGTLSLEAIERLIQRLSIEAFGRRAERFRRYLGWVDRDTNLCHLEGLIRELTRDVGASSARASASCSPLIRPLR